MAIDIQGTSITLSNDGALRNQGVKVDYRTYHLTATADKQKLFTLPFSYVEGDDINIYYGGSVYQKGADFTVVGAQITILLDSGIPELYIDDKIEVYG